MIDLARTTGLFLLTALAEILGCYLVLLWLRLNGQLWLLLPAGVCLAAFAWLLTLHPHAAGRVYAAYGGVYVAAALVWLWAVESVRPTATDLLGAAVSVVGMMIIVLGARQA